MNFSKNVHFIVYMHYIEYGNAGEAGAPNPYIRIKANNANTMLNL